MLVDWKGDVMWLARDRYGTWLHSRKPRYDTFTGIFCSFKYLLSHIGRTDIKLRIGECVEVELCVKRKGKALEIGCEAAQG